MQKIKSYAFRLWAFLLVALFGMVGSASAQTDITGVISEIDTYKDLAIVIAIAILLFVLGRKVVRRFL